MHTDLFMTRFSSRLLALPLLVIASLSVARADDGIPPSPFDGQSWWSYVKVLADDNMEGRQVGSVGLRKAQAYVIEQFNLAGLEPAGSDGYRQSVSFVQRNIDETKSSAALVRDGKVEPIELGGDAFFNLRVPSTPNEVNAPLVFVGNGLRVPEVHHDDLAGLDVKGKIVVFITGSPEVVTTALSGHYSSTGERTKMLREAGAIGFISIPNPASMDIPWIRMTASRMAPAMDLADARFDENSGMKVALTWNPAQAEKLFEGTEHRFQELALLAKDRKPLPHFQLTAALRAHAAVSHSGACKEIVGELKGKAAAAVDRFATAATGVESSRSA